MALWNAEEQWIEMRLRSTATRSVAIADLDMTVAFGAGEDLLTEISAKFTPDGWQPSSSRRTSWSTASGAPTTASSCSPWPTPTAEQTH